MKTHTLLAIMTLLTPVAAYTQFCALRVAVYSEELKSIHGGSATLFGPDKKVAGKEPIKNGLVEFCRMEFGLHTIAISVNGRYPVELQGIRVIPDQEQFLKVILNGHPRLIRHSGNACVVLLRVVNRAGEGIRNVEIHRSSDHSVRTSVHGFARVLLGIGETETFRVRGSMPPESVEARCSTRSLKEIIFRME